MKRTNSILLTLFSLLLCSCVHEFAVIDNSFEFEAAVTYYDAADVHRLTLTRKSGSEDNQYIISFTVDGESTLSLTDLKGKTFDGTMTESFTDVSARTYTLSRLAPGEHTLTLDIRTDEFSQSLSVVFMVEDFSFAFDTKILFDEKAKEHSLEVSLKEGAPADTYTITYTIDNQEPKKTYQETFTDAVVKTYLLPIQEPGEHTVNVTISTDRHSQKADLPYTVNDYSFQMKADIEYDRDNLSHILFLTLMRGSRDDT